MASIGLILLVGLVKKNGILPSTSPCTPTRAQPVGTGSDPSSVPPLFRPILMTTLAALFGAVPSTLAFGDWRVELREPLGVLSWAA